MNSKHLFTLQQGISRNQLEEKYRCNVTLVVPQSYLSSFPKEFRERILTLQNFIDLIRQN
ncbi:type II restriction endonuclease [Sphingobacterium deserti]|uniref:type II restriction endonuclease n=1 Tax=Sphingobacterium deserti TaxID=1229276 RepID=UPI0009DF308F